MRNKTQKTITVLYGIPACGKTFYAQQACNCPKTGCVDLDKIRDRFSRSTDPDSYVLQSINASLRSNNRVIIDGLLTTNEAAIKLIKRVKHNFTDYNLIFEIVWWELNREACLNNDRGRRKTNSTITIQNIPFEKPNRELLKEYVNDRITKQYVYRKPESVIWKEEIVGKDKLESERWCLGGTGSSYTGNKWTIDPEPQPSSFTEFDNLLESICPDITFLQYKKLYSGCCKVEQERDRDYYSDTSSAFYVCDLDQLFKMLVEMGIKFKK